MLLPPLQGWPEQLPLPALAPEERVAIYFTFADGTVSKVHGEDPE